MFKKSAIDLNSAFYPSLHFTLSLQSAFYTQSAFYPWSAVCSLQSAVFVLQWPVSNLSVRETSVGQLLEADVQPNFVAQLSGDKNWKASTATIQHLWTHSEKCRLSWIVSQVHSLSPKETKSVPPLRHSKMSSQSNKSSLRPYCRNAYWQVRRLHI